MVVRDHAHRPPRYRGPMRSRRSIRLAAVFVAGALALTASGCSPLIQTPPESATSVLDAAVRVLEATEGVASVSSRIEPKEPMASGEADDPDTWVATLSVTADPDAKELGAVLDAASEQAASVRTVARVDTTVSARLGPAAVSTMFALSMFEGKPRSSVGEDLAAAGVALASIPGATAVTVPSTTMAAEVLVAEPISVPPVAASVRALASMGSGPLTAVTVRSQPTAPTSVSALSVTLDAAGPSDALVETLAGMLQAPSVESVTYSAAQRNATDTQTASRPDVKVTVASTADANEVAAQLAGLDAGQSVTANSPRASFSVFEASRATSLAEGFLGLPMGSPQPDDVTPGGSYRSPEADSARLEADRAAVSELLTDAATIAGISGNEDVRVVTCSAGVGQQAAGSVVIPIFDVAATADDAYAKIVESWEAAGLVYSEGALGTAIYAATSPTLLVQHATIRGTADGISIHAEGGC